tara:strand:+ start:2858 stop:5764 length:2907 start_codon:yes stop_codon:yes gene_type:complete
MDLSGYSKVLKKLLVLVSGVIFRRRLFASCVLQSLVLNCGVSLLCADVLSQWNHDAYLDVGGRDVALTQSGDLVRSVPGAGSWDELVSGDERGRLTALSMHNETVIAVGECGVILRMDVAGNSLSWAESPRVLGDLYGVSCRGNENWVAVGSDGARAVVLISEDDGRTWDFAASFDTVSSERSASVGVRAFYYVDSLYGDDSKDGLSPSNAKKSITSLGSLGDDVTVYLARGSEFREQLNLPRYGEIRAYGDGDEPIINAADIASNDSFVEQDGFDNVYRVMWRLEVGRIVLAETVQALEDAIPLAWVDSLEECNSTPGSYYENGLVDSLVRAVYIHPSDSTDLRFNSKTYEISKRDHAVSLGSDCTIVDVELKNNAHNDGSLVSWYQLYGARLKLKNGTKHIALTRGDTFIKDTILEHTNNRNRVTNAGQFVVYDQNLRSNEVVFSNTRFAQNVAYTREAYAFISHRGSSGKNRIISFSDCSFENFKLAHAGMTLESDGEDAWGGWFVRTDFINCDNVWNSSNQTGTLNYLDCYFDRMNPSTASETILFTGAQNGNSPTASLVIRSSSFNVPETRVLFGTFVNYDFCYNSVNGVDTNQPRFLAAVDLYDGDGLSGDTFDFRYNHISGYSKPWRYKTASQFNGYSDVEIDYNYYTNFAGSGKYEWAYDDMSFSDWQIETGNDINSVSGQMDDFDIFESEELRTLHLFNTEFDVGEGAGVENGEAYEGVELQYPTAFRDIVWHSQSSKWVAVGESEFGIRGCVFTSFDGEAWDEIVLPAGVPGLNVVGVDAAGVLYAAGRSAIVLRSTDSAVSFGVIHRGAIDLTLAAFASLGSGQCLFGGDSGLLMEYVNGFWIDWDVLASSEDVYEVSIADDGYMIFGSYGRDAANNTVSPYLTLDFDLVDDSVEFELSGSQRGNLYVLYESTDVSDEDSWSAIAIQPAAGEYLSWLLPAGGGLSKFYRVVDYGPIN